MGVKVRWDLGNDPGDSALEGGGYAGDLPPKGVYRCKVVGARVKPNKNNDPRVNFWIEIQEPKGSAKAQYNGYRFYDGQNVAQGEVQQRVWKQIAHALGVAYKDISTRTTVDSINKEDIEKFAGVKVEALPFFNAVCKRGSWEGDERLEMSRWLPWEAKDVDDDEDDGDDDDQDDEPPF